MVKIKVLVLIKNIHVTRMPIFGLRLQTRPKSWSTRRIFWAGHYHEIMFSKFSGVKPPYPLTIQLDIYHIIALLMYWHHIIALLMY